MSASHQCAFHKTSNPKVLSEKQIETIHRATLDVLERTGVRIEEPQSLELLHGAGADISDRGLVRIPADVVEKAIEQAPSEVVLYNRKGSPALRLGGTRVHFGAHGDCPEILDPATAERRRFLARDGGDIARVCDALPNIEFISLNGFADDAADARSAVPLIFAEMVANTVKPLGFSCADEAVYDQVLEIAALVVGSEERVRARPFFYHYSEPTSPLVHSTPSLRRLIKSVESGIPVVYTPMPMAGATAPCSLAGTLMVGSAESLTGLVIAQLLSPGAPYIYGGIPGILDMRTTVCSYGAPEMLLMAMAMTDMAHHYGLPMFGTAGCTDAKRVDPQAAAEAALSCYSAVLSGANLVHDVGLIDHADMVSAEMMVLCDEIIAMLGHATQEIDVSECDGMADLIDRVGPGGHFLTEEHTLHRFREFWYPSLMDRTRLGAATKEGPVSFSEKLNHKTRHIMATHEPEPLPPAIQKELSDMTRKWLKPGV